MANDYFNSTLIVNQDKRILGGNICFYAVASSTITESPDILHVPPIEEVMTLSYFPYLNATSGLVTVDVDLHSKYMEGYNISSMTKTLKRVTSLLVPYGVVFSNFVPFGHVTGTDIGGTWKWQNEGKLWMYPFHECELYDGISTSVPFYPELIDADQLELSSIRVRQALNTQGIYQLYIHGYKGDTNGLIYGTLSGGLPLPTSNNAYINYLANNQNTLLMQRTSRGVNAVQSLFTNPISALTGLAIGELNEFSQQADLKASGYSVNDVGADTLFNLQNTDTLKINIYGLSDSELERVGYFFHLYGYAQQKTMTPNLKSRRYFNYLKTSNALMKSTTSTGIPKEHLEQLKSIFNEGVTVWHMNVSGNYIGNYTPDNIEV